LKRNFVTENSYPRHYEAFSLSLKVTCLSLHTRKLWRQWTTSGEQRASSECSTDQCSS